MSSELAFLDAARTLQSLAVLLSESGGSVSRVPFDGILGGCWCPITASIGFLLPRVTYGDGRGRNAAKAVL
jgi:hypothetical protein